MELESEFEFDEMLELEFDELLELELEEVLELELELEFELEFEELLELEFEELLELELDELLELELELEFDELFELEMEDPMVLQFQGLSLFVVALTSKRPSSGASTPRRSSSAAGNSATPLARAPGAVTAEAASATATPPASKVAFRPIDFVGLVDMGSIPPKVAPDPHSNGRRPPWGS